MKLLVFLFIILFSNWILACPTCAASSSPSGVKVVTVLCLFILLTYVPFALIFRKIKKYKALEKSMSQAQARP